MDEKILERMRLPRNHWGSRLAEIPDACEHKEKFQRYVEDISEHVRDGRGLLLLGKYSTGKSACAAICLKAAAVAGHLGLWINAREILSHKIQKTPFDEEFTLYERVLVVPVLVVDEVTVASTATQVEAEIENVVRSRLEDRRATIVTTNEIKTTFTKRMPGLAAAMKECMFPLKCGGHDFREERKATWEL